MRNNSFKFILLLVLLGGLMFFIFRPFAYLIAIALIITITIVGLIYAVKGGAYLLRKFRIRNSIEGIIEDKISLVMRQISKLSTDSKTIVSEIEVIDAQLNEGGHSKFAEEKLLRLRTEFEIEGKLNREKLDFFQITLKRLSEILSDQEVLKKISTQKTTLEQVRKEKSRSSHIEDSNLSTEKAIIEELDYLTLRMQNAVHVDEAREIQKELVNLYR